MHLYEISKNLQALLLSVEALQMDAPDDDHYEAVAEELNKLQGDLKAKACDVACVVKGLLAEAAAVREEERRLAERRGIIERRAEYLKRYLGSHLEPGEKFGDARVQIGWRSSASVEVDCDPAVLPPQYQRVKIEADKATLTQVLKAGHAIEGVRLIEKRNIQIK